VRKPARVHGPAASTPTMISCVCALYPPCRRCVR
jgi:hypothetical protein